MTALFQTLKTSPTFHFLTLVLLSVHLNAQDVAVEQRFLKERNRLKQNKIFQISERHCLSFVNQTCGVATSDLRYEYFFDDEGYLKTIKDYHEYGVNVTVYISDRKGGYRSKTYKYYDTDGNLMHTSDWLLDFDDRGRIFRERLSRKDGISRTNILEYNEGGDLLSKTTDSTYRWTQTYDAMHRWVEQREWRSLRSGATSPDFRCISVTTYAYQGDELVRETVRNAESNEIWKDRIYKYDSSRHLVEIEEHQTFWRSENGGPTIAEVHDTKSLFWNDTFGNPQKNCAVTKLDTTIHNCVFYTYNSSHRTDSTFDFVKVKNKKVEKLIKQIKKHPKWTRLFIRSENMKMDLIAYSYPSSVVRGNTFSIWGKYDDKIVTGYRVDSKTYTILNLPQAVVDLR